MGRTHSPERDAWVLLKRAALSGSPWLTPQWKKTPEQSLYDAEMQSQEQADPEFEWPQAPQPPQLPPGPSKLTDFDSTMFDPEEPDNRMTLGQVAVKQGIPHQQGADEFSHILDGKTFVDRMLEDKPKSATSPYLHELRSHIQNSLIPHEWTSPEDVQHLDMPDDVRIMYDMYLHEGLGNLSPRAYFSSAFDPSIPGGLLDMGEFGDAAEIRGMLRDEAKNRNKGPEGQPPLGAFHPHFPNPHDLAWVEPSPDHPPELAAQIEHDRKHPMSFFRQTPEMSRQGRTWVDPETGELTSTRGSVPLDPYTKTIGLPRLTSVEGTGGFEGGVRERGKASERPFPMRDTPGLFATVPNLKDIQKIVSITGMGQKPVYTGIRGDPHKEPMWLRTPDNAPEDLHEVYLHEAQPASKLFDPFSLIPGRERAEKHGGPDFWRVHNLQAIMERLIGSHIPSISASLDREGKPMMIDTGRGEMDVLDYMEDIYDLHGRRDSHNESQNLDDTGLDKLHDMVNHLSEKYDLPAEMLKDHFSFRKRLHPHSLSTMQRLAENRFMYNAAKTSGIDFHPTRKVPFPRDEHGFPLNPMGEQMSSNALNLLGLTDDENNTDYRAPSEVRHPRMPLQDEQVLLNPPSNKELSDLQREYGIKAGYSYLSQGMTDPMKEALRDLRSKQKRRRGVGNETV